MSDWAQHQCDVELKTIELYSRRTDARVRHDTITKEGIEVDVLLDEDRFFASLLGEEKMESKDSTTCYALIVRPDGHIADIKSFLYNINN